MSTAWLNGRYELLNLLGSGGEATVFRARDRETDEFVAARMAREPDMTQKISEALPPFHTGWVSLIDGGVVSETGPYQIYELLEGQTLAQLLERGPLHAQEISQFMRQALDAVEALHALGWAHGDLNPDNFVRVEKDGRWMLLELPFLRFIPAKPRSPLFGNILTLAPEQIDGAPASVSTDLYALGCLFYAAASGKFPHAGADAQIAVERLLYPARAVMELVPGLNSAWAQGIMRLLERKPEDRPASVAETRALLKVA